MSEHELTNEQEQHLQEQAKWIYEELQKDPRAERLTTYVSAEMYEHIRKLAYHWDMSKSQVVHELVQGAIGRMYMAQYQRTGRPVNPKDFPFADETS